MNPKQTGACAMATHQHQFIDAPKKKIFTVSPKGTPNSVEEVPLIVAGQGIISSQHPSKEPFSWTLHDADELKGFRIEITANSANFYERIAGTWNLLESFKEPGIGLDSDPTCIYWFSLDHLNRCLRYGKGEMRLQTMLAEYLYPPAPPPPEGEEVKDPYEWMKHVHRVLLAPHRECDVMVWRDPITVDPPLRVKPTDKITMEDVAIGKVTVPANLTSACQKLYNNISGENFQLDTEDFPHFVEAIEASIRDPRGWCYDTLKKKANEFGEPDPKATYLRITMGVNQGDSPGIPYVMEIWPGGHYSPIHNHANANAIIRVLSGEITASLYPMLSADHSKPFAQATFGTGEVTWISPGLNQTHKLHNTRESGPTCITIQCYLYGEADTTHYEYFDYLSGQEIKKFTPNSDKEFLKFKALMKKEWDEWYAPEAKE